MGTWDYNKSDAFASINNMHDNFSWRFNHSNYTEMQNMTQTPLSADNATLAENSLNAIFTPITGYWAAPGALGAWFYVILMFVTVGMIYGKTKQLETAALSMLILSLVVALPATTGTWHVPAEVLYILYVGIALSIAGGLYLMLTAGGRN